MGQNTRQIRQNSLEGKGLAPFPRRSSVEGGEEAFCDSFTSTHEMPRLAKQTILVGSGKGGVGKSTVSLNLAVALSLLGLEVGLLDADLYGPSLPLMAGLREMSPPVTLGKEGEEILLPFSKFGVKLLSIGFFLEEARSVLWRGPMLHGMLQKMTHGVEWGQLDVALVDLPPGTGDVPLSLSKLIQIDGAVVVTTPQSAALVDVIKAIHSFDQLEIPLLGIVENMAGFRAPETGQVYSLFGKEGGKKLAGQLQLPLLGSVPILEEICEGGEEGLPAAFHSRNREAEQLFRSMGETLREIIHGKSPICTTKRD